MKQTVDLLKSLDVKLGERLENFVAHGGHRGNFVPSQEQDSMISYLNAFKAGTLADGKYECSDYVAWNKHSQCFAFPWYYPYLVAFPIIVVSEGRLGLEFYIPMYWDDRGWKKVESLKLW
jgi:hypothetical protein